MAHFAQLNSDNVVIQVIVVSNKDTSTSDEIEIENIGISFCQSLYGNETNWKQTSYNRNIRGNYAGIGYTYMENVATLGVGSTDIFIDEQPHPSWSIDPIEPIWCPPVPEPILTDEQEEAGFDYYWDESVYQADNTKGWIIVEPEEEPSEEP